MDYCPPKRAVPKLKVQIVHSVQFLLPPPARRRSYWTTSSPPPTPSWPGSPGMPSTWAGFATISRLRRSSALCQDLSKRLHTILTATKSLMCSSWTAAVITLCQRSQLLYCLMTAVLQSLRTLKGPLPGPLPSPLGLNATSTKPKPAGLCRTPLFGHLCDGYIRSSGIQFPQTAQLQPKLQHMRK